MNLNLRKECEAVQEDDDNHDEYIEYLKEFVQGFPTF